MWEINAVDAGPEGATPQVERRRAMIQEALRALNSGEEYYCRDLEFGIAVQLLRSGPEAGRPTIRCGYLAHLDAANDTKANCLVAPGGVGFIADPEWTIYLPLRRVPA